MSDETNDQHEPRPLSEISHLFLSSIRDKATGGKARPQRTPPPAPAKHAAMDMTPEEFAQVFGAGEDEPLADTRGQGPVNQVTAVIAAHLNGHGRERVTEYAKHLANDGTRVGVIEVDPSEFRITCFDRFDENENAVGETPAECFDPRQMTEVLAELSWDVQRWLLVLPQPRVPEARVLLRGVRHWAMLSTCDHDGVISCYRTLKGLIDLWPSEKDDQRPRLSLALLDAMDNQQADRVGSKLTSVCQQFLNWPLELEPHVRVSQRVCEHLVMCCRPIHDKSQLATAPQWQIVADFLSRSAPPAQTETQQGDELSFADEQELSDVADAQNSFPRPVAMPYPEQLAPEQPTSDPNPIAMPLPFSPVALKPSDTAEVIDLPGEIGDAGIVEAILRHCSGELVECPIAPPMCPKAKLAVSRDRRIVLLAVAREGLADLNSIGQAYRWLKENQALIGMAVPQLSIDTHQPPHLSLLVNTADSAAQTLQPMLQGQHVTVKTYRKLRWGGRTGLLLEAA